MLNKKDILEKLKECYDPEIPINVVDPGLIYDVQIDKNHVQIKMMLTSPACPMADVLAGSVKEKAGEVAGVDKVDVEVVRDPPWTPERISQAAKDNLNLS